MFSWFLGSLQHCLINWEQDLCAIKCSGEVADAKALHLGFESISKVMGISVYSHLGKAPPPPLKEKNPNQTPKNATAFWQNGRVQFHVGGRFAEIPTTTKGPGPTITACALAFHSVK